MFEHCSYPASNLGDFSGFFGEETSADQIACGYPTKAAWKAARKPRAPGCVVSPPPSGGGSVPPEGTPRITPGQGTGAGSGGGEVPAAESDGGGLLSGIPSSYLMIGAVVILLMMLKK